jgi:hypothetical protein
LTGSVYANELPFPRRSVLPRPTVVLIGTAVAVAIGLLGQSWSDPTWFEILAICTIGWFVGIVVGGSYWALKPEKTVA